MSSVNWTKICKSGGGEIAFETGDFYLACFLRCIGYDLIDLRAEGRRKVSSFRTAPPGATT
jgi:hypothetical protein